MATTVRVRPQPCMRCGEKILIIESQIAGLGGLWRLPPSVAVQHADFEPADAQPNQIDNACRRSALTGPDDLGRNREI